MLRRIDGIWIEPNGTVHDIGRAEHDQWIRAHRIAPGVPEAIAKGWTVGRYMERGQGISGNFYLVAKDIPTLDLNFETAVDALQVPLSATAVLGVHTYSDENIVVEAPVADILATGVGRKAFEQRMTSQEELYSKYPPLYRRPVRVRRHQRTFK